MDQKVLTAALQKVVGYKIPDDIIYAVSTWIEGSDDNAIKSILNYDWPKEIVQTDEQLYLGMGYDPTLLFSNHPTEEPVGVSWSTDINVAEEFANQYMGIGVVLKHKPKSSEFFLSIDKFFDLPAVKQRCEEMGLTSCVSPGQSEYVADHNVSVPIDDVDLYVFGEKDKAHQISLAEARQKAEKSKKYKKFIEASLDAFPNSSGWFDDYRLLVMSFLVGIPEVNVSIDDLTNYLKENEDHAEKPYSFYRSALPNKTLQSGMKSFTARSYRCVSLA